MKFEFLNKALAGLILSASMLVSVANAGIIFTQDYESGLTTQESIIGNFSINNTNSNNNGTFMMGHPSNYLNNALDQYILTIDLTGVSNSFLSFDFIGNTETHWDGFVMLANGLLISPTSGFTYSDEGVGHDHGGVGHVNLDGNWNTLATFDLSAFDNTVLTMAWKFGTDGSVTSSGLVWDNVVVRGDVLGVPEPSTLAIFALGMIGLASRRFKKQSL